MSHMKGIHVSFDIVDEFIPRVPRQRCPGEDETVPRICVAEDILNAVNAVPQAGLVMENMRSLGLPVVIHAYYLTGEGMGKEEVQNYVPDAKLTGEFWLTENPGKYGVWTTRLWILQRKRLRIRLDTTLRLL